MDSKKNVMISIKGMQEVYSIDDSTDVELLTEGEFYKNDGKYYAVYQESDVTGMEGTTTTVEVDNDKVSIIREGTITNQMIFIKDKKTTSYYDTQFGALTIGVLSDKINVDIDDNGGIIDVGYSLEINEETVGKNQFYISIREA